MECDVGVTENDHYYPLKTTERALDASFILLVHPLVAQFQFLLISFLLSFFFCQTLKENHRHSDDNTFALWDFGVFTFG